jgi:DNA-binding transcriptional ArsR family regulator
MTEPRPLDVEARRRIFHAVRDYPGLHVREISRQVGMSVALVEYHLRVLADNGLVEGREDQRFVRMFAVAAGDAPKSSADRGALGVLRSRLRLQILLILLDHPGPMSHGALAAEAGLGKSKLSFHLRRLERAGLVRKTPTGWFEPANRRRVLAMLLEFKPTPDLLDEFEELWLSLYGKGRG